MQPRQVSSVAENEEAAIHLKPALIASPVKVGSSFQRAVEEAALYGPIVEVPTEAHPTEVPAISLSEDLTEMPQLHQSPVLANEKSAEVGHVVSRDDSEFPIVISDVDVLASEVRVPVARSASPFVFGNMEHIHLARQRRKSGKVRALKAEKKKPVVAEVHDIPAVTSADKGEEPLALMKPNPSKKKVAKGESGMRTLWDECFEDISNVKPAQLVSDLLALSTEPEQLSLW
ncbi:hypothetical protein [Tengunoibacter tsumagoiensis]|uniref:Uncharacterized protein n=1 Tax=Tengunoibacter tsumagoiensis TaxID=2014871 RepID=A0A402A044_9CHLR|nr:hypothetical protein [Tengunoibacter tsumagoiensis]GCE12465.1 hypothetical protein KTT_23240 [Tengunoibacter tsumagoiensis]